MIYMQKIIQMPYPLSQHACITKYGGIFFLNLPLNKFMQTSYKSVKHFVISYASNALL